MKSKDASDRVKVIIYTAKPGVVIGKGGAEIEKLKAEVAKNYCKESYCMISRKLRVRTADAQLVAENIAQQLENRISFRRAMKSMHGQSNESRRKGYQDILFRSS